MKRASLIVAILLAAACSHVLVKPTDRTEVMMPSDKHAAVVDITARALMSRGWQLRSLDQKSALFARQPEGSLPSAPYNELHVTFADAYEGVRVCARVTGTETINSVEDVLELVRTKVRKGITPLPVKPAGRRPSLSETPAQKAPQQAAQPDSGKEEQILDEMKKRALKE